MADLDFEGIVATLLRCDMTTHMSTWPELIQAAVLLLFFIYQYFLLKLDMFLLHVLF